MKKIITLGAMAMLLSATSCSTDESVNNDVNNDGKEKIQFAAGDNQVLTSRAGFKENTKILARFVSESRKSDEAAECVKTILVASQQANDKDYSVVDYLSGYTRYWDDAHGRYSKLSVYAVAVPNVCQTTDAATVLPATKLAGSDTWANTDVDNNSIEWGVTATQTEELLNNEDLTYSNNIQQTGDKGVYTYDYTAGKYLEGLANASHHEYTENEETKYDGRLYFTQQGKSIKDDITDAAGHFDRGQLEFKHALSRVQVNLVKGAGYESAAFNVTEMKVLEQFVSGTFNIKTAEWSINSAATAVNMAKHGTEVAGKAATYEAQMLPGYTFANDATNALQLTVDGNTYYITNAQLRTALSTAITDDNYTMQMGNRYVFDVTVAKNKIQNITATIIDWNDVNAANTDVDNSHATFTFYGSNTADNKCTDVKLWKYEQPLSDITIGDSYTTAPAVANTTYSAVAGFQRVDETSTYKTSEYYNDNKTAYHFRSTNAGTTLDDGAKTFTMTSGSTDYHWGAPMKTGLTSDKLTYSTGNGYLSSIEKGIVAASKTSNINLTEVHMMSQLVVKLTTPNTGAAVNLDGATVTLTKFSKTGSVDMGSGLITPAETYDDLALTYNSTDTQYELNVVPQLLARGTDDDDYVGITIHTTDNNEYYIVKKLSEIIATSVGSEVTNMQEAGTGKYITRWYPGHKYIYTFNITKTEIKNITATIVGWNEVVADNTNIGLED